MAYRTPHILIIGGDSRIARALTQLRGGEVRRILRRSPMRQSDVLVEDYAQLPASVFEGIECVINCVGISTGSAAVMERANVEIPLRAAQAAKAAGVRRFIHISSFSVYGGAQIIDRNTPVAPATDYGRSKLMADQALQALCDERFAVTMLRLPLIYGKESLGKVGQLLRLWQRLRVFPVPANDVSRAMIGVEMSGEVVNQLCSTDSRGIVFAADPQAFSYARISHAAGGRLRIVRFPQFLSGLAERIVPSIADRLFKDSRLSDEDNLAVTYNLKSRLYKDLVAGLDRKE